VDTAERSGAHGSGPRFFAANACLAEDVSRLAHKFIMTGDEPLATFQDVRGVRGVRGGVPADVGRNITSEAEMTVVAVPA
jgi:hypothetical protein